MPDSHEPVAVMCGCMSGPEVTSPPTACEAVNFEFADFDADGDVDMRDYADLMLTFDHP